MRNVLLLASLSSGCFPYSELTSYEKIDVRNGIATAREIAPCIKGMARISKGSALFDADGNLGYSAFASELDRSLEVLSEVYDDDKFVSLSKPWSGEYNPLTGQIALHPDVIRDPLRLVETLLHEATHKAYGKSHAPELRAGNSRSILEEPDILGMSFAGAQFTIEDQDAPYLMTLFADGFLHTEHLGYTPFEEEMNNAEVNIWGGPFSSQEACDYVISKFPTTLEDAAESWPGVAGSKVLNDIPSLQAAGTNVDGLHNLFDLGCPLYNRMLEWDRDRFDEFAAKYDCKFLLPE